MPVTTRARFSRARHVGGSRSPTATSKAARASRRVESSVGSGETSGDFGNVSSINSSSGIGPLRTILRSEGTPASALAGLPSFGEFTDLLELLEVLSIGERYSDA